MRAGGDPSILGFGGLFLVLSYHLWNLWSSRAGSDADEPRVPGRDFSRRPS
ncbi:MAG: hypothetical protein AVDCRST_MAG55-2201 [uncultured Rubrobacteraceae bacterium]|uniref:Uncharacterized protein n=1 Tax=uncultured Rubrobacteraceae bacterium TaxID=349277 RepID=A0A6J4PS01_9ACTN|nr:MAG: hypothetical protein AVDCRST_MAG55-2201 [uncultured Rubrobacteraceae bacterium]